MSVAGLVPILLLSVSNLFMTVAWYGHLRFPQQSLLLVIVVSWGIALFEYCLAVPANRFGYRVYSAAELKTIQEVITLSIFVGFSYFWLGERITWNILAGFGLIAVGAALVFWRP